MKFIKLATHIRIYAHSVFIQSIITILFTFVMGLGGGSVILAVIGHPHSIYFLTGAIISYFLGELITTVIEG